jgi:chloramphenicol 3-O-phosphotransferase
MLVSVTPVLLLTGPIGVGKSAVRHEADALLIEASVSHATVVLEEIAGCWPVPPEDPVQRVTHMYRNLAGLWSNYAARGAGRLLLEMLVENRSELRRLAEAIPGAEITMVRLHAPLALIEERIRRREPDDPEGELCGARWWAAHMQRWTVNDCLVVDNGDRPVREVASEVLRAAHWLGG